MERRRQTRSSDWFGPALLALLFVWLCRWSWLKWPDPLIDFGEELYVPWQLALGKALYRDIAYKNGPLSFYANALWFSLFGVSLTTLVAYNLAIFAATTCLVYRIFARACDHAAAFAACAVLLIVFGFSQYVWIGNYNYVCPYSHCQTHGAALSAALVFLLGAYARERRPGLCGLAGLCLGLLFLTKLELFVAAAAAAGLGFALIFVTTFGLRGRLLKPAAAFGAGFLLPSAAFFAFLRARMSAAEVLRGLGGNCLSAGAYAGSAFYRGGIGVDALGVNLQRMVWVFFWTAAVAVAAAGLDFALRPIKWRTAACACAAVLAFAAAQAAGLPWFELARALPAQALVASAVLTAWCVRRRRDPSTAQRLIPLAMWAWLSFFLLGKMLFNARFQHYGFVLAMPATLLLVVCLVSVIPTWLSQATGRGDVFRALMVGLIACGAFNLWRASDRLYAKKTFVLGNGGDRFLTYAPAVDPVGKELAALLGELEAMPPGSSLLVLPEGAMVNYLARRGNPTPYTLFLPPDMSFYGGQDRVLDAIRAHPPDAVALVHRNIREFGAGDFGSSPDNGGRIMDWIRERYRLENGGSSWFSLFKRKDPASGS